MSGNGYDIVHLRILKNINHSGGHVMFEKDTAASQVASAVSEVKSSTRLDTESQSPKFSGHESADYGSGPDKSAAGPRGVGE